MEKYRALVVCGTGMGSSMLLKIMVERVITRNELPITLEADVLAGATAFDGDFIIAMADLLPHLEKTNKPLVGIKNMVDKEEILGSLNAVLAQLAKK
jgi:PTS system ascorbate-specific IIB component